MDPRSCESSSPRCPMCPPPPMTLCAGCSCAARPLRGTHSESCCVQTGWTVNEQELKQGSEIPRARNSACTLPRAFCRAAKQFACNAPVKSMMAGHARQQADGCPLQLVRDEVWPATAALLRGHEAAVTSVAIVRGPGGHGLIASGSEDKTIRWVARLLF